MVVYVLLFVIFGARPPGDYKSVVTGQCGNSEETYPVVFHTREKKKS